MSHAHIDHSGLVPLLFKYGYKGPVYCTLPTRDVMVLLQLDTIKIQASENKPPLYTTEEIKEMVKNTITLEWGEVFDITPDVRVTLYPAGHMLGASEVHLHIGNGLHNLVYSGDIKLHKSNLLDGANTRFPRVETLIIESTYGGKDNVMPPPQEEDELLRDTIRKTIDRKGKILMPVLGSGRAQEMMVLIENMVRNKEIPEINVYIDGMVWDITAIHTAYPEYLSSTVRKRIFHDDENPFLNPIFKEVGSQKERDKIIESSEPCIILATSGMLVGGPSVAYLKGLAEQKKNALVFSSYLGVGSLGRRIFEGEREITFTEGNKQEVLKINLEVSKIDITGHCDRKELMNFVHRCSPKPRKIIVNHGESSKCLDLASSLHKAYRVETIAPRNLEAVRLR